MGLWHLCIELQRHLCVSQHTSWVAYQWRLCGGRVLCTSTNERRGSSGKMSLHLSALARYFSLRAIFRLVSLVAGYVCLIPLDVLQQNFRRRLMIKIKKNYTFHIYTYFTFFIFYIFFFFYIYTFTHHTSTYIIYIFIHLSFIYTSYVCCVFMHFTNDHLNLKKYYTSVQFPTEITN